MMGGGGMIVMDDRDCVVDLALYFLRFLQEESCGKCLPCRLGLKGMEEFLHNFSKGHGSPEDLEALQSLAQALVGEPELVILDEPAANLDPLGRMDVLDLVSRFSRDRNVSFLISTHILYDVERTCDWIGIMDAGKVGAQGSVEELIRKYSGLKYRIAVSDPKTFGAELAKTGYVVPWSFTATL
jgi:ABC-type multidrug transport system ATPase subunit